MILPSVCVIIPTRERADTLAYTLQTCVQQDYENLEILVCDNFSQDNTADVVGSLADRRIRYINPGRRVSMADNWEYAVSQANADFVTVLGDDDALLPNSLRDLIDLATKHDHPIVTWSKVEYCWPNHIDPTLRGLISIPLRNRLVSVKSSLALKHMYQFLLSYNRGPCIYNSLVSMNCIKRVLERDGRMFQAASPDVYSSLALASVSDRYLFSTRPFSINGASAHSGGTSHARPDLDSSPSALFQKESSSDADDFYGVIGSLNAAVVGALTNFAARVNVQGTSVNYRRAFKRIINDIRGRPEVLAGNRGALEKLADKYGVRNYLEKIIRQAEIPLGPNSSRSSADTANVLDADNLNLWGNRFDIRDVAAAASFAEKILGTYTLPSRVSEYSLAARIFTRILQRATGVKYYFGM
jgi:glycosyltransferase involved in cell wall biosynthesis